MKVYYVYILSNQNNTVLYTGVTNNLERRLWELRNRINPGSFTCKYNVTRSVWYETFPSIIEAIKREKQIKGGQGGKNPVFASSY